MTKIHISNVFSLIGRRISGECEAELLDTRRSLMNDYLINPEVVIACRNDIERHCEGGVEREGRTLHCLMEHAKEKQGLEKECVKAVSCIDFGTFNLKLSSRMCLNACSGFLCTFIQYYKFSVNVLTKFFELGFDEPIVSIDSLVLCHLKTQSKHIGYVASYK